MFDCLIVGGGVIGMLTALHLQTSGLQVILLERGTLGQESSWAGGGILSPLYPWRCHPAIQSLVRWSQANYPSYSNYLIQSTGIDPEYTRNGLLILDTEEFARAQQWAMQERVTLEKLNDGALRECEPELDDYVEALWFPNIAQIRNPRLIKSLRQALHLNGVNVKEQVAVRTLRYSQNKVTGVETKQQEFIPAQRVVVAAGAWSDELLRKIGLNTQITPVRGQMILFKTQPGLVSRITIGNDRYVIPRRDGCVLVGSTVESVGFNKDTTRLALENLKYAAISLIPRLADYEVQKHWAGLRPGSPQGIPIISKHPTIDGLYINAGHFRNGLVTALASAQLMTDIVLEKPPIINPTPYAVTKYCT